MHASRREADIMRVLKDRGLVTVRELERIIPASSATIRRDLARMAASGLIDRSHGAVAPVTPARMTGRLAGTPFARNVACRADHKARIGHAAAALCDPGEAVMIDGGSTTLQMCDHIRGLGLQVLTNSLHIVSALLTQPGTRVLVPSGTVFPDQAIILPVFGEDGMPRFHAPKLFMGAASVGPQGVMQADALLVAAERRLMAKADQTILLVDSSKFGAPSGQVVCGLSELHTVVTDREVHSDQTSMLENAGVRVIVV
jgi:DeoR family transcriptional regulator, ulaG and ulaABCDEF operon transcriptional repressor